MAGLLYVTPSDLPRPRGGRAQLAALHARCLADVCAGPFATHQLQVAMPSRGAALRGYIDGITPAAIAETIRRIDVEEHDTLWLDGANLGRLAQAVRCRRPRVRILTFCHNVEARFFLSALRRSRSPHAAGVLAANVIAERLAMRHSDMAVALSSRDSQGLRRLYQRGADAILPMAVADARGGVADGAPVPPDAPLLFVGGAFYANRDGIDWFARTVAPRIDLSVQIVGQGMESLRGQLAGFPNVQVIGAVDRLEPFYRAARAAIAPIFDGSGMKTKVAEALMFGKPVIGTPEAFSGYDAVVGQAGWVCETPAQFVEAIAAARARETKTLDPALRALYEREHSEAATGRRLAAILG